MSAEVIKGEDTEVRFYLDTDMMGERSHDNSCSEEERCRNPFPLTGCTGVSGEFLLTDGVSYGIFPGYVVSSDLGIAGVPLSQTDTNTLFVGKKQKVQLYLQFGTLTRKVQFSKALDVLDDIANQQQDQNQDIQFC